MTINKEIENTIVKRLFVSLGIILFIRIGTFIPVPGINQIDLAFYLQTHSAARTLISTFSGDDSFVIGLFTLNIFPYISASIFVQLILGFLPSLAKLQKEGNLEGRRFINRLTRSIVLIWCIIQSLGVTLYLKQILFDWNYILASEIIIWLTTGAMIVLWLSELITDYGLGNGASLIISSNIISNIPNLSNKIILNSSGNFSISSKLGIVTFTILIFASVYGIIFLQRAIRNIPLISSKQLNQLLLVNPEIYIPLRFNQSGVMPIILTTTILVVPNYISNENFTINFDSSKFIYWIGYFGLIFFFSSFYSTFVLNPKDLSDQLQKMAVTIAGIRPGIQTTFYLKQLMKRITFLGSIMLATLTTVPLYIESTLNLTSLNGLSTTSLLILTGVILEFIREIENIYYSNFYKNMYQ